MPSTKFHKAYPYFRPDLVRVAEDYGLGDVEPGGMNYGTAVALLFSEYADALDA
jgi:hypothetical protein